MRDSKGLTMPEAHAPSLGLITCPDMEDLDNSAIGCFCTLLESWRGHDSGEIVDDSGNQYVVLLTSGQHITLSHDDVMICD